MECDASWQRLGDDPLAFRQQFGREPVGGNTIVG